MTRHMTIYNSFLVTVWPSSELLLLLSYYKKAAPKLSFGTARRYSIYFLNIFAFAESPFALSIVLYAAYFFFGTVTLTFL